VGGASEEEFLLAALSGLVADASADCFDVFDFIRHEFIVLISMLRQ
jgi:hypothetical protein